MPMSKSISFNTASSIALVLPELVELIGLHLQQEDLYSCVQVCRSWNRILTPLLWREVDDRSGSWKRIISKDTGGQAEEWVRSIFAKYGHHIRRLTIHSHVILEAAMLRCQCQRLRSLLMHQLDHVINNRQDLPLPSTPSSTPAAMATTTVEVSTEDDPPEELLSPLFEGNLRPRPEWVRTTTGRRLFFQDRLDAQKFWLLVHQNPSIVRLQLPTFHVSDNMIDDEFIYDTLSTMKDLKVLNLGWIRLSVRILLKRVPQVERLQIYYTDELFTLDQDYNGLRSLVLLDYIRFEDLFKALDRLPSLEVLRIKCVSNEETSTAGAIMAARIERPTPLRPLSVRIFEVEEDRLKRDGLFALIVGQFPRLVSIQIPTLYSSTLEALWDHCYYLDDIRSANSSVVAWRERRAMDVNRD
ncbi:hypothetical protein BGX23_010746 [Mortierella sp. AD031]|nr:hypothetical protein BGX23_010746 [Mortierella sp. AD031]